MKRMLQHIIVLLGILTSISLVSPAINPVRAQATGLVCIDSSSSTSCPSSAPTFTGSPGSSLTIAINVQGSDSFNGFDIRVQADPTIINGSSISIAGSVIQNPLVNDECVNGFFMAGACQSSPGTVEVILVSSSSTTAPTTGRLFSVTYHIAGATSSTPILYPTGCTSSSVSGTTTCVAVSNGGTVVPENVQAATFSNSAPPPDFTITATPSSQSIPRGSTATFTVRIMGINNFNGTVTLSTSVSPIVRHGPVASIPSPVGPFSTSTLTVSTTHNTPTGTYTVTITGTSGSLSHSTSITLTVTR